MESLTRRELLAGLAGMAVATQVCGMLEALKREAPVKPFFETRGVVLTPADLDYLEWPERAHEWALTTIGLHHGAWPRVVADYIRSDAGQEFLSKCRRLGLQVEYELHALRELLPRDLFEKEPTMFRMDEYGERNPDCNLCVHSLQALAVVAENAIKLSKTLHPTTGRYFLWLDDGAPMCHCPKCKGLSDSDQALVVANALAKALRKNEPHAKVAYIAYANTMKPPSQVMPEKGVFLEFAPLGFYKNPRKKTPEEWATALEHLDANLKVFGAKDAKALEYWLDDSAWSGWQKPAVELTLDTRQFDSDLDDYGKRGIRHATTFAVFMDAEYVRKFGLKPVEQYADHLKRWRPK